MISMNLASPGSAFTGTLTVPILRALDGRGSKVTPVGQVHRLIDSNVSLAGVRRALDRLAAHGILDKEEIDGRAFYSLNFKHVLYPAVKNMLDASGRFGRELRRTIANWTTEPVSAVLFGSAARRDGDVESDIDLLLVRPTLRTSVRERQWAAQVHELRGDVLCWTGNHAQIIDWSERSLRRARANGENLIDDILRDGITVAGDPLSTLLQMDAVPRVFRESIR